MGGQDGGIIKQYVKTSEVDCGAVFMRVYTWQDSSNFTPQIYAIFCVPIIFQ